MHSEIGAPGQRDNSLDQKCNENFTAHHYKTAMQLNGSTVAVSLSFNCQPNTRSTRVSCCSYFGSNNPLCIGYIMLHNTMVYTERIMSAIACVVVLYVNFILFLSSFLPLSNGFTPVSPPHERTSFSSLSFSQVRLVGRAELNAPTITNSFSIDRRLMKGRGSPMTRLEV